MAHGGSGGKNSGKATIQQNAAVKNTEPDKAPGPAGGLTAPPPGTPQELIKYVLVELDVSRNNHKKFRDEMHRLTEIMFDYKGWELVYAAYPITGVLNRFVHIWKIPDESDILEVMREGALNDDPSNDEEFGALKTLEEQFRWCYQHVQAMIERTTHTVMTSLPYDPEHVGYQSQTILVDATGEKFLIDHRDLRSNFQDRDISQAVEDVRRAGKRTLSCGDRAGEHNGAKYSSSGPQPHTLTKKDLPQLQRHLNQGAIVAKVDAGNGKALLFNLAGLKPRSVFQQIAPADVQSGKETALNRTADGEADIPVNALLIAAPWGAVYELGPKELQNRKVVKLIGEPDLTRVNNALQPLLDANAPIAAIPEERDQTIGDGCACYIINLSSFVAAK